MDSMSAKEIAALCLSDGTPKGLAVQLQSTEHRIAIVSQWADVILLGSNVLELGCGQGDTTAVLAVLVGKNGKVTAVDPGSLDYGWPFTLGQAQSHLSSGRLGSRIVWSQSDPLAFLSSTTETYDVAVLSLCTWYFASPAVLSSILSALATRAKYVCIAEWALFASSPAGKAHVLAALTQAAMECKKSGETSESNVRTLFSPKSIQSAAEREGWKLKNASKVVPKEEVLDGRWEVGAVRAPEFWEEVNQVVHDEREKSLVNALRDATLSSLEEVGGMDRVRSMDVWCSVFVRE